MKPNIIAILASQVAVVAIGATALYALTRTLTIFVEPIVRIVGLL